MKHGNWTIGFLLLLLIWGAASAQQAASNRPPEADRARLDELRVQGATALYNLDYEAARHRFEEITRLYPDHPVGPLMLASTLWLEKLNQLRRLQAALYSTQSFYAKTEEKADPRIVEQFRSWTSVAKRLAAARVKRDPRDIESLYYLGATDSLKAAFEASLERRFIAALRDASSSIDRMHEVIKRDPNFHDAELTIGLYDYVVGTLSLPVRLLANIAGFRGSKKRGIATLQVVAKEAQRNRDDAKIVLIALLKREKRFAEALAISQELSEKYPRNHLFRLESADALASIAALARAENRIADAEKAERASFAILEALMHEHPRENAPQAPLELVHLRYGEALMTVNQPERASQELLAASAVSGAEPGLVTLAHLRAGQAFDLAAKRTEALVQYRIVLGRPNVYNSQDEARKGLREPYRKAK